MSWLGAALAAILIAVILIDAFEAMILPRRVRHAFRLSRQVYFFSWRFWRMLAGLMPMGRTRAGFLSIFGPLSLFALLTIWAMGLIFGFALLHWSIDTHLTGVDVRHSLGTYVYYSGTTFVTLGLGDLSPQGSLARALTVAEAGMGFGFLAVVISYLPVLYQAFSKRETTISLLDARAGSPPTAGELLRRLADARSLPSIGPLLSEWEKWSAELLENHLSFPVLRYYRSQHDNQSWVATLTMVLDASAFLIANVDWADVYQARLTFAMARHAAVDLVLISRGPAMPPAEDRLPREDFLRLRKWLEEGSIVLRDEAAAATTLAELRGLYEPFINVLGNQLLFALPPFVPAKRPVDNWQTSPGMDRSPGLTDLQALGARDEHAS
jgi:hypothetical protein